MIVGTTLFKMDGTSFFSPEFARGGLAATFVIDVTHLVGSPTVTFTIQHRNSEDTTFSATGDSGSATTASVVQIDAAGGLKEIIRIVVSFDAGDAATDGAHFLIQPPTWRPY